MTTPPNSLHAAAGHGDLDTVRQLIDEGTDYNVRDDDGMAPLHVAAERGYFTIVDYLVSKGAAINIRNKKGQTPLHLAAKKGRFEKVLGYLIGKGAGINIKENDGLTPLHIAIEELRVKTAEFLVNEGANVNSKDKDGMTPLHVAAKKGECIEIVIKLKDKGADINIKDNNGQTPLHTAAKVGNEYTMRELVELGANMNIKDNDGRTPLAVAAKSGYSLTTEHFTETGPPQGPHDVPELQKDPKTEAKAVLPQMERHLATLDQAIQRKEMLNKTIMQCVFMGIPRSGKTSLMKRIVGENLPSFSPSTGLADKAVQVLVRPSAAYVSKSVNESDSTWTKLSETEEAAIFVMDTSRRLDPVGCDPTLGTDTFKSHLNPVVGDSMPAIDNSQSCLDQVVGDSSTPEAVAAVPQPELTTKNPIDICRCALQNAEKIIREPGWLVYLTDTGGQIEFQELLPQLLSGPTVFFLVFPLDKKLNERFKVKYVYHDGSKSKSYMSTFTLQEALIQSLTSIASMACNETQVFFVGTHSDNVSETEINLINDTLQREIKSNGYKNIVQNGSESRMLLAVDNLSDNDSGIQQVRKAVERLHTLKKFNVCASPSWLILGLIIRQLKDSVLSYKVCLDKAKNCNITTEKELNQALSFLHTKVGVIRHFQEEGLQNIVIQNPQVLFDCITTLVEKTFTFENDPTVWKEFKEKGIFPFSTIEESSKSLITSSWLVNLLKYLHIIAPLEEQKGEEKYFMPCALARAQPAKATSKFCRGQLAHQIPSLLVCFTNGYCPHGLFAALVVYLLAKQKMKQGFQWRLKYDEIFKDQISFSVGPLYTVSITMWPDFFEITCTPPSCEVRCIGLTERVCLEVRTCIKTGIQKVTTDLQYRDTHYLAYECTRNHQGPNQMEFHTATILDCHGNKLTLEIFSDSKPCTLECKVEKNSSPFPPGHEIWFPEVNETQRQGRQFSGKTDTLLTLKNIDPILAEVLDWHNLGVRLDLPVQLLQEIKVNYSTYGTGRQKQEMITTWLEYDTEASWDKLANALKEMGKHVAANKIWNTYGYRDDQTPPNEGVRSRERDRRINMAPVKHRLSDDFSLEPELKTVKQARVSSPKPSVERLMSHKGGGSRQEREREWDSSAVSKSSDFQIAPPPPPHDNKRGQKRSPSGSSVSDDSLSPPPVKKKQQHKKRRHSSTSPLPQKPDESREQNEEDQISELEIGQSTGRTAGSSGSDTLPEQMKLKIKSLEADNEKLTSQLDQDKSKPSYNSFLGVEVVDEVELVVTNETMNFQWKDNGFKLHVPENALPEGITEYSVNIKVSLTGQFEIPEGYELVSAVYWMKTPGKFTKPVAIEVQHCANFNNPNQLCFVRTSCTQKSLPYKYKVVNGGSFVFDKKYGVLSTTHFSGIGVAKKVEPDEQSCKYCAQVYFTVKNLKDYLYYCHFVVTKDLEMCIAVAKRKYKQEYDIAPPVTFDGDQVALDIPDDGTKTDNGWEIVPAHKAHIKKDRVDNFSSENTWVPECVLLLEWKQKDAAPETLKYKVKLKGTGEENDFFRIVYNPAEEKYVPLSVMHQQQQQQNDEDRPVERPQVTLNEDDLRDVKSAVADLAGRWKDLGISLGIHSSKLDTINSADGLREMLALWLRQNYNVERFGKPTWKRLVEAVKDDVGGSNVALAQKIAKDHPGSHAVTQPHLTS